MTALHTDLPNDAGIAQDALRATDSLSDLDARLIALSETAARLTAEVKTRARACCCPKCGHYFTLVQPEESELDGTRRRGGETG